MHCGTWTLETFLTRFHFVVGEIYLGEDGATTCRGQGPQHGLRDPMDRQ